MFICAYVLEPEGLNLLAMLYWSLLFLLMLLYSIIGLYCIFVCIVFGPGIYRVTRTDWAQLVGLADDES